MQGNHAAESLELFIVAFANFAVGGTMVFLDPERLPSGYRKMVMRFGSTARGRKRWGWFFMFIGVILVAMNFGEFLS